MLTGLRAVEFEGPGPAPVPNMMLAEPGAEVVVVHRRGAGSPATDAPDLLDRGKRSIVLDLKAADDVAVSRARRAFGRALVRPRRGHAANPAAHAARRV